MRMRYSAWSFFNPTFFPQRDFNPSFFLADFGQCSELLV